MHGHQLRLARDVGKTLRFPTESHVIIEWLEHGWPTNDTGVTELLMDPFLRAYKDDPRFIAFAQKIGVMPTAGAKP